MIDLRDLRKEFPVSEHGISSIIGEIDYRTQCLEIDCGAFGMLYAWTKSGIQARLLIGCLVDREEVIRAAMNNRDYEPKDFRVTVNADKKVVIRITE